MKKPAAKSKAMKANKAMKVMKASKGMKATKGPMKAMKASKAMKAMAAMKASEKAMKAMKSMKAKTAMMKKPGLQNGRSEWRTRGLTPSISPQHKEVVMVSAHDGRVICDHSVHKNLTLDGLIRQFEEPGCDGIPGVVTGIAVAVQFMDDDKKKDDDGGDDDKKKNDDAGEEGDEEWAAGCRPLLRV
ncbi:unnamed protein product [Symbiodinium sp. CCMP2592]|nr:unnamed protein product [Symbiodinium sp. CCMP2592]